MVDNSIVRNLGKLGFSGNEAKAYLALLSRNPATAYEIAKNASIPTSKIYQVIAKLERKGVVMPLEDEGKKRYIPLTPDDFIQKSKDSIDTVLNSLGRALRESSTQMDISVIWNLRDYGYLLERTKSMIKNSSETLLLSGWGEELALLSGSVEKAENRGVEVAVVHFGPPAIEAGHIFQHPIEDTLYGEKGGRGLAVVSDSKDALIATILTGERVEGAFSRNRGFVTLAEDYIKHDIYIMKIVRRYNTELITRFGENYKLLRDVFNDEEEEA